VVLSPAAWYLAAPRCSGTSAQEPDPIAFPDLSLGFFVEKNGLDCDFPFLLVLYVLSHAIAEMKASRSLWDHPLFKNNH
jgi:hypothetical protein